MYEKLQSAYLFALPIIFLLSNEPIIERFARFLILLKFESLRFQTNLYRTV